ncbi:preprotein translocase subunit YajC [Agromyces archimandritae]|uniref:Preprotein translocase subunit YajC n=1 Tax=Agromyces archimandritae TaxID=2781962 RepID=A0A975INU0_9MICO|nr:preprotein translocase subunit YajC [Agromyces archimandritae]QTX04594.1 preprotein translocase subunit YajC [Agromyces archimandritae]
MDPFTIIMLVVLAVLIFFMFRNSRKRQAEARELQSKVQPGADVMTNFGVFGTILSIDEDENQVKLETSPGTVLTVHRQTIARVIDAPAPEAAAAATTGEAAEPEFGERIEEAAGEAGTSGDDASGDAKPDEPKSEN